MKYVSKKIAEIAKERGLQQGEQNIYHKVEKGLPCNKNCFNHITHPCEHCHRLNGLYYPTMQELVEWIFEYSNTIECDLKDNVKWLEFWYQTLISELYKCSIKGCIKDGTECITCKDMEWNKFVLEGFIGMLINWFDKNSYNIELNKSQEQNNWIVSVQYKNDLPIIGEYYSKIQARHEGIIKCFELMKGE